MPQVKTYESAQIVESLVLSLINSRRGATLSFIQGCCGIYRCLYLA
jgi:hypothetical protein